ncbi:MAG: serine/threonine-protein kinase [Archangium sp.]
MSECVDDDVLLSFAAQKLDAQTTDAVARHVSECSDCRIVLAEAGRDDRTTAPRAEPGAPLREGMVLGRYVLGKCVGAGGMGAVYEARDPRLERRVAIKVLRELRVPGDELAERSARFERERLILASLEHPNIARLLDGGQTPEGRAYLVLEFVEGTPIDQYCADAKLSVEGRLGLFRSVCEAVHFAHRKLVVHRDLKPTNILVTREGQPRLVDFGIARLLDEDPRDAQTAPGFQPMTPEYASPEQLAHQRPTTSTDVYSLGVVLYELLTGRLPYELQSKHLDELARAVQEQEPKRPSEVVSDAKAQRALRGDVDEVVLMALRKSPEHRYASAERLGDDLLAVLENRPTQARRGSWLYRTQLLMRRHKGAAIASIAALLAITGGSATTVWQAQQAQLARERAANEALEAARLAGDAERMQELMRVEWLLPPHDLRPAYAQIKRQLAALEANPPAVARAEAAFTKGRGLQLLGDDQHGVENLEAAWDAGLHRPAVARALALSESRLVEREVALLGRVDDPARKAALVAKATEKFRARAAQRISELAEPGADATLLTARLDALKQNWPDALAHAQQAEKEGGDPLELAEFVATVRLQSALELFERNDPSALEAIDAAAEAAKRAASIGRSAPRPVLLLIRATVLQYDADTNARGFDPQALAAVTELLQRAESLDAEAAELHEVWSSVEKRRGDALESTGGPAKAAFESAIAHAERAVKAATFDPRFALLQLANTCHALELFISAEGGDPLPVNAKGLEAAVKAEQLAPGASGPLFNKAQLSSMRAWLLASKGEDARAAAADAVADARRFVANGDRPVASRVVLADVLYTQSTSLWAMGDEADAPWAEAVKVLREATTIAPKNWNVQVKGVESVAAWANQIIEEGRSPDEALAQANAWADGLAPLLADNGVISGQVGSLRLVEARIELMNGRDPTALLAEAERRLMPLAHVQSINVDLLSSVELTRAKWADLQHRDSSAMIAKAVKHARAAQALDPQDAEAVLAEARALVAMKKPDAKSAQRALELAQKAVDGLPKYGVAVLVLARAKALNGDQAGAAAATQQALAMQPRLVH